MNNVLLYLGGLLVAVLSALFAVPHFVDWNGYRGVFEEEVSRLIGREVRVGGEVNVRLLPTPYVRFEKIRVADATGGTGEPFFRADAFTLWLSVPPLLRGVVEANEVELRRPRLNLRSDAAGRGNWSATGGTAEALPLVPAGVALQAVRISEGSIGFKTDGGADVQLDGVEGELEAEALEGPYKFRGTARWRDGVRQVRLATARADAEGGVRLKLVVTAPQSGNSYVVDGRLADLGTKPRFDGEVQGKIRLGQNGPAAEPPAEAAPPSADPRPAAGGTTGSGPTGSGRTGGGPMGSGLGNGTGNDGQAPFLDLKAAVAAELTAVRLSQLVLSVENVGQPQLISGDARADWGAKPAVELALTSRWLDLDRLAGRSAADQPIETAQSLVADLLGELPDWGGVDARFDVEQTTLGGEAVSGLGLRLRRETGALTIRELRAGLPGGARLDITGELVQGPTAPELDGRLVVRGSSLSRFLTWAGRSRALVEGRSDGPFLVRGRLRLGETRLALTEAAAELAGVPLEGDLRYEAAGDRRRLALRLDGQTMDIGQVWPGGLDWLATLLPAAAGGPGAGGMSADAAHRDATTSTSHAPAAPGRAGGDAAADLDLELRVRVAELVAGPRTLRDVDADLALEKGRLTIPRLRLVTSDGLEIDVEGEIADAATAPKGTLRGLLAADRPEAVESLVRLLGEPATGSAASPSPAAGGLGRLGTLLPLRLAGRVTLGGRTASALDVDADGLVQGGRFVAAARLDGGWRGWRDAPADVSLAADSPDADLLLRALLSSAPDAAARGRTARRGQVNLKAQGVPAQGLLAAASMSAQGLVLSYDGPLKLEEGAAGALDGELRISADSVAEALDLAGVPLGAAAAGLPLEGLFHVASRDNVLTVKPRDATLGAQRVTGHLIVARRSGGRPSTVTASLEVGEVTLADLLTPVLDRRSQADAMAAVADPAAARGAPAWPEHGFDLSPTDRVDGKVEVRFKRLGLGDALALGPGRLSARIAAGRVEVEALDGPALGGTVAASASLARVKGGVEGAIKLRMSGLKPGHGAGPAAPGGPSAAGSGTGAPPSLGLTLDLAGRGTSPRTLVGALKGQGVADLDGIELAGLTPEAVQQQSLALAAGRIGPGDGALTRALESAAATTAVAVPPGRYVIEAGDGVLRIKAVTIATPEGRTTVDTSLDLGELRLDSEWRIDAGAPAGLTGEKSAAGRAAPLPPVYVVYAGPLGTPGAMTPRISAGALERELSVRKLERDVDELERIRREDEQRRTDEAERQRRLEAERAAATADPRLAAPGPADGSRDGGPGAGSSLDAPVPSQPPVSPQSGLVTDAPQSPATERPPIRVTPPPRAVRRVSPGDEILRNLSPN